MTDHGCVHKVIRLLAATMPSLSHVLIAESAALTKLLQALTTNQVVLAVSHDDMQTQ